MVEQFKVINFKKSQCHECRNYINDPVFSGTKLVEGKRKLDCRWISENTLFSKDFDFELYHKGEAECPHFESYLEHLFKVLNEK